ncbi:hypothetical protein C0J52_10605 [Blattella germanica]|nr:hypothetical protein C0J52_10605 [Blattella germanica]
MSCLKENNEDFLLAPEGYNIFVPGPVYRNLRRQQFEECKEPHKRIEGIQNVIESLAISLHTRISLKYNYSRSTEENTLLDGSLLTLGAKDGPSLLDKLYEMPEEWTVIQLSYAYEPGGRYEAQVDPTNQKSPSVLHMIRFACGQRAKKQAPYLITIPIEHKYRKLIGEMNSILEDHKKNFHWNSHSQSQYFKLKGTLGMRMKNVVQQLENKWLGVWASLLIGYYVQDEEKVHSFVDDLIEKHVTNKNSVFKNPESRDIVCQIAKASAYLTEWDICKAHKDNIRNGQFHVDANLGYYIVNPQQNLPNTEKRLQLYLPYRAPSWTGTFGVTPSSDDFKNALMNYNVCWAWFWLSVLTRRRYPELQSKGSIIFIWLLKSNKQMSWRKNGTLWYISHPMVVGNLWPVTDSASDVITMYILHTWLSATKQMKKESGKSQKALTTIVLKVPEELCHPSILTHKHEPDLLYAIHRTPLSLHHYLSCAALVFRGLPITVTGNVDVH